MPLKVIEAFETTDGVKFLGRIEAQIRQDILDAGNKPCAVCNCKGVVWKYPNDNPNLFGGWQQDCAACGGHGYLIPGFIKP